MEDKKESVPQLFGGNVRKYRKQAGLTQEQLSERLDITQKHLSIIETGPQFASAALIEKIADVLQVSPAELFADDKSQAQMTVILNRISLDMHRQIESMYQRLRTDIENTLNR